MVTIEEELELLLISSKSFLGEKKLILSKFPGSYDLVTLKDKRGTNFTTRIDYVTILGQGNKTFLTIPRGEGVKKTIIEERDERLAQEDEEN
jgi:small subunit ribosomal protein S4e